MKGLLFSLLALLFVALGNFLFKVASNKIGNSWFVAIIIQIGALIPVLFLIPIVGKVSFSEIHWPLIAGVFLGITSICLALAFSSGGEASEVVPIINMNLILVFVLGAVFLKEKVNWWNIVGLITGVITVFLMTR